MTAVSQDTEHQALTEAVSYLQRQSPQAPSRQALVEALLNQEKHAKRIKQRLDFAQLLGTWRLGFTTGTVKSRQRAGTVLGAGRFLPRFLVIQLSYAATELEKGQGTVENSVALGPLKFQLTGPTQFWPKTNSLAFDFTHMQISLAGLTLYRGAIRGGDAKREAFYQQTLKEQAFFTYFAASDTYIAARGRGGGLALWTHG